MNTFDASVRLVQQSANADQAFAGVPENLAIRSNGDLLVTSLSTGHLVQISHDNSHAPTVVYNFASLTTKDYNSLSGVGEIGNDVFAVAACERSPQFGFTIKGSCSIFKLDLTQPTLSPNLLADFPGASGLQDILKVNDDTIIISDTSGAIWSLNINGNAGPVVSLNQTDAEATSIGLFQKSIYYSDPKTGTVANLAINIDNPSQLKQVDAAPQIVDSAATNPYGVVVDNKGNLLVADSNSSQITWYQPPARSSFSSTYIKRTINLHRNGANAGAPRFLRFGRTPDDISKQTLYYTASGILGDPGFVAAFDFDPIWLAGISSSE